MAMKEKKAPGCVNGRRNMRTNMESKPMRDDAENAAAAWLLRRGQAQWSVKDQVELDQWLDSSAHHRVAYIRLQAIWGDVDRLKSVSAGLPKGQVPERGTIEQSPFFTIRRGEPAVVQTS